MLRALVIALVLVAGCGGGSGDPVDGGPGSDAEGFDAARTDRDAASTDDDAAVPTFDSGPPSPCTTPGALEHVACGACGTVERFCTAAGTWAYGTCSGEGACMPGTIDAVACGRCGTQPSRCTSECVWEATGACEGEGECDVGTRSRSGDGCDAGSTREVLCNDACTYEPSGACEMDGCPTPGVIESSPCGSCGTVQRFCTAAHAWEYGECVESGVCAPGTTRTSACGACGTRTERCLATCGWDTSAVCTGEGACFEGETRRVSTGCGAGQTRRERCDVACSFQPDGPCEGAVDAGARDAGRTDAGTCAPAGSACTTNEDCCTLFCFSGFGCF